MYPALRYRRGSSRARATLALLALGAGFVLAAPHDALAQTATFEILSSPGPIKEHQARSVSFDGTVVAGYAGQMDGNFVSDVYLCDEANGMTIVVSDTASVSHKLSLAPNGSAVVGTQIPPDTTWRGFRASLAAALILLEPDPSESGGITLGLAASNAFSVGYSDDSNADINQTGFYVKRWSGSTGALLSWPDDVEVPLDNLDEFGAFASADGSIVAVSGILANSNGSGVWRALVWENDMAFDLPPLAANDIISLRDMSTDGSIIIGSSFSTSGVVRSVKWTKGQAGSWIAEEIAGFLPSVISNDMSMMIGRADGSSPNVQVWDNGVVKDLEIFIVAESGEDLSAYTNLAVEDLSADGSTMVGRLVNSRGEMKSWRFRGECTIDTDEDGLLDCWETVGIPYFDEDSELQLFLLDTDNDGVSDADPLHKDLFVEVDVMLTVPFRQSAINDTIASFATAPLSNPNDPNNRDGIDLHVLVDEQDIAFMDSWNDNWTEFDTEKADHFGTTQEQTDMNAGSEVLDAKAKAFRYCLWVNKFSPSGAVGWGETPGNDFAVAFGGLPAGNRTREFMGSTFMHELGHTLDLEHGGADAKNYKPNHVSVMNYAFDWFRDTVGRVPDLDYCRDPSGLLTEWNLDETAGFTSQTYSDIWSIYSLPLPSNPPTARILLNGSAVDWNGDGDKVDTGVAADINRLGDPVSSPDEPLVIGNEWDLLVLPIGDTGDYVDGQHSTLPTSELSADIVQWFEDNVAPIPTLCLGDTNGDGAVNFADITDVLGNWLSDYTPNSGPGDANADGLVNFADITDVLGNWLAVCP